MVGAGERRLKDARCYAEKASFDPRSCFESAKKHCARNYAAGSKGQASRQGERRSQRPTLAAESRRAACVDFLQPLPSMTDSKAS